MGVAEISLSLLLSIAPPPAPHDLVVLVHGMGRTPQSMIPLQRALETAGYEVLNYRYPSRDGRLYEHGLALARRLAIEDQRPDVAHIHMMGHSLGNLVIRWVLANDRPDKTGRVVMLAPPNQGAKLADMMAPWLSWFSEPLPDLTTHPDSAARTLATPAGVEIGTVAGAWDHLVRPDTTCLAGQTDHIVVSSGHTFIARKRRVHELAIAFLRTGSFGERKVDHRCPHETEVTRIGP